MQRLFITGINGAWFLLVLVGVPAATRLDLWKLQVSWAQTPQLLSLWGFGLGALANLSAATVFLKAGKAQDICAKWTFIFTGFWLFDFALFCGWINFDWLKSALRWLQKQF